MKARGPPCMRLPEESGVTVRQLTFTVDSRLLRELGERLVGRPHIALAELVKNSYDADASQVVISFLPDRIEVVDDGHGMSPEDFEDKWLRIGSTHKEREAYSPRLHRPLTGSKGVGRLAVQLLANRLEIRSIAESLKSIELAAYVDWTEAVEAGDLTKAPISVDEIPPGTRFTQDSPHGTKLILTDLNHLWGAHEFEELARELWPLQSPFEDTEGKRQTFRVTLRSPYSSFVRAFDDQMQAVLELWTARLTGELLPEETKIPTEPVDVVRSYSITDDDTSEAWDTPSDFSVGEEYSQVPDRIIRLDLQFHDGPSETIYYRLPNCHIDSLDFQIRVYQLQNRQPKGISVSEARAYLRRFGGVHVYDTGFHLPYYGPDTDWLHIEIDHSHRLSRSRLLPKALQRPGGLSNLPTNSRLFGAVNVNTAHEQRIGRERYGTDADALAIQVSRDRLTQTAAYRDLVTLVRWALDYYAMNATRLAAQRSRRNLTRGEKPSRRLQNLQNTLNDIRDDIPEDTFEELSDEVDRVLRETQAEERRYESYLGLLGALATAGISALAYEHEVSKQFETLDDIALALYEAAEERTSSEDLDLAAIARQLEQWLERARATHRLFSHLLEEENRTVRQQFPARRTLELIKEQVAPINFGVEINLDQVSEQMTLPPARYVEWSAILQNLFTNAFNAMRDSPVRRIDVSAGHDRGTSWLLIQDTGVGVDLDEADELFEPFVRRLKLGPDHVALALGGSGLGLTIVRMMAEELECNVGFVQPDLRHATAVRITWKD
jgi:signal transduction histidine kinase